jgi:DNA-3-methyladenine glycosylase II
MKKENKIKIHFEKRDPIIYKVMKNMEFDRWHEERIAQEKYFEKLTVDIISQQLSLRAADTIYERFRKLFKNKKISADDLHEITEEELRGVGMSWAKARYVRDLAEKTINHELKFNKFNQMGDEEIEEELIKVKGIGKWTVEMFLIFSMRRDNIFSFGDAGLRRALNNLYNNGEKLQEREIEKIIQKWDPYKSYGCLALWEALDNKIR